MSFLGGDPWAPGTAQQPTGNHITANERTTIMPTIAEVDAWEGQDAYGPDAEKIGEISDIYLDQDTGRAEWLTVKTGLLGGRLSFVPLSEARAEGDHIRLSYDKDMIKDAPKVDANDELSGEEVAELYRFYGMDWYESPSDSRRWQGEHAGVGDRDINGRETDHTMTRSEEDLDGATARHEGVRGRLRRHFATEQVPTQREEHRVAPEPITDPSRDQAMGRDHRMVRDEPVVGAEAHRR